MSGWKATAKRTPWIGLLVLSACATIPDYEPIVDTASIEDEAKFQSDMAECKAFTDQVDYSDEKTVAALKGAAVGAGVVGTGVAVTLAAGGGGGVGAAHCTDLAPSIGLKRLTAP